MLPAGRVLTGEEMTMTTTVPSPGDIVFRAEAALNFGKAQFELVDPVTEQLKLRLVG